MRFDILTIFPDFFYSPLREGIIRRAMAAGQVEIVVRNIRDFTTDRHNMTDDRPFGGGEGMVMKPEPLSLAIIAARNDNPGARVVLLSPQGCVFTQKRAAGFVAAGGLILVCGRYEGIDQRLIDRFVDQEISIGDYILTGGELASLVLVDAVTRLVPGVLGCGDSAACDTFSRGLLKHPQYTRPREFEGEAVPDVLLSGDHDAIRDWRLVASVRRTLSRRPGLLVGAGFDEREIKILQREGLWPEVEKAVNGGADE